MTKRDALKRIQATVDDRFKGESPEFREQVLHWLDSMDADMDSGIFDVQLSIALYITVANREGQLHGERLDSLESYYQEAIEHYGKVRRELQNAGSMFSDARQLSKKMATQHEQTVGLGNGLAKLQNAMDFSLLRAESLQPKINQALALGLVGLVGSICFPSGWIMGWNKGQDSYSQQHSVMVGEFIWKHNSETLSNCIQGIPNPCSVTLVMGSQEN